MTHEHFRCSDCGPHVAADEDGCCAACGADCYDEPCGGHVCGTVLAAAQAENARLRAVLADALGALRAQWLVMHYEESAEDLLRKKPSTLDRNPDEYKAAVIEHQDRVRAARARWSAVLGGYAMERAVEAARKALEETT